MNHSNRLARETSPYLLQHAHNPVDWYPWGEEAFDAARSRNKPIFLSVGYSTCYWCHVMERQCFENESISELMNEKFINIKVDREERPDVDQLYMMAVQVLTQHGGWPMSVFLLPDLRPFYGGTYFPPEDAHGRPGFPTLLRALDDAFHNRRDEVEKRADQITAILKQLAEPPAPDQPITIDEDVIDELIDRSIADYDTHLGGFGSAPKFPRETLLELLLTHCSQSQNANRKSAILKMICHTLDAMANGGMRDHLGGGFHRYSTDARWLVPHFEIMLYDQAMLAWCYVEAFRQTNEPRYARIARGAFDFVLRGMTSPEGAFYTALDAEVDGQEGLNYLWTTAEIEQILDAEDAKLFNNVYGLDRGPNFADPHHGSGVADKNTLYLPDGPALEDDPRIDAFRQKLLAARSRRKQPLLDTKVITSWNALMIRALAHGAKVLNDPTYLDAAQRAASFALQHSKSFLDDYAFLMHALLALHESTGVARWSDEARKLFEQMQEKFAGTGGFYFTSGDAKDLIVRQMIGSDSPLPSGNAIVAIGALQLGQVDTARSVVCTFAQHLIHHAEGMGSMVQAALLYVRNLGPLAVSQSREPKRADRPPSPEELASRVLQIAHRWRDGNTLEIRLQIARGFHLNAHDASEGLVATELRGADRVDYPPGHQLRAQFADKPISVYHGEATLVAHLNKPANPLLLSLRYQACDESACLPPATIEFEIPPLSNV